mmetsp:Transcript_14629/g.37095  ORF Transcript_14629/g.37095 Transcript_14629/m.37095 type:complete len:143 (-) Transcript_14629:3775-4203(-)
MRGLAGTEQCAAGVVVAYPVQCDVDVHNKLTLLLSCRHDGDLFLLHRCQAMRACAVWTRTSLQDTDHRLAERLVGALRHRLHSLIFSDLAPTRRMAVPTGSGSAASSSCPAVRSANMLHGSGLHRPPAHISSPSGHDGAMVM